MIFRLMVWLKGLFNRKGLRSQFCRFKVGDDVYWLDGDIISFGTVKDIAVWQSATYKCIYVVLCSRQYAVSNLKEYVERRSATGGGKTAFFEDGFYLTPSNGFMAGIRYPFKQLVDERKLRLGTMEHSSMFRFAANNIKTIYEVE